MTKLYKVIVLGGALAAGCGSMPEKREAIAAAPVEADAGTEEPIDAGVADAGTVTEEEAEEATDGGGVCPWSMAPCPC